MPTNHTTCSFLRVRGRRRLALRQSAAGAGGGGQPQAVVGSLWPVIAELKDQLLTCTLLAAACLQAHKRPEAWQPRQGLSKSQIERLMRHFQRELQPISCFTYLRCTLAAGAT